MCKHDAMTVAKWMIELYDPDGTFKGCTDKHHKTRPDDELHLPFDRAPDIARTDMVS